MNFFRFVLPFMFVVALNSPVFSLDLFGSEADALQLKNSKLEDQVRQLQAQLTQLQEQSAAEKKQTKECQDKLAVEAKRGNGIKIIFFGGDIIYELNSSAFSDYRAGLRLRSLHDQGFGESLSNFENGRGGDMEMLSLLKEIDVSKDRMIDDLEAKTFRSSEEQK